MKQLVPVPEENAKKLKEAKPKEFGYQYVSVKLKDGRCFEQAVASEGYIIAVKGHTDLPFAAEEVESVTATAKTWNFRRKRKGAVAGEA